MVPRLQLVDCCDEDHDDRRAAAGGPDVGRHNHVERSVGDVQRSERHVG
jgi:hypothetical protein